MGSLTSMASAREHLVEELNDLRHAEDLLIERKKESRRELKAAFLACSAQTPPKQPEQAPVAEVPMRSAEWLGSGPAGTKAGNRTSKDAAADSNADSPIRKEPLENPEPLSSGPPIALSAATILTR